MRGWKPVKVLTLAAVLGIAAMSRPVTVRAVAFTTAGHPAVGSWFGRAVQLCPAGVAVSACAKGQPALALFMTPTLTSDGLFLGNDSLALGKLPFGPHTTAHGQWEATSATEFKVDYVFMLNTYPAGAKATIDGLRFRWAGLAADANTLVGYVNIYFHEKIPVAWTDLGPDEYPAIPPEASGMVTSPRGVVTDPNTCIGDECPLVFRFTVKRVAP